MSEEKEYLRIPGHVSVKVAAEMIGLSYDRTFRLVKAGRIPSRKVGGKHMIPVNAVEEFKRNPPGRVREKAPAWRVYDNRIRLLSTEIRVRVRPGCLENFEQKLHQLLKEQLYKFPGTMGRYIFKNAHDPELVTISLLWKNNEMADEVTLQRELDAFKTEFSDILDWEHAEISYHEGLLYT